MNVVKSLVVMVVLSAAGCAKEPAQPPPNVDVPVANGTPDAGAIPIASASATSEAPALDGGGGGGANASAIASSPFPPTGEYKVTERLVSSDCQPKFTPPSEPWTVQVHAGAEKNYAKVNVPLSAIPPSNATGSSARSDVVIEPRKPIKSTYVPMPQCPSYSLTRTMEIAEASAKSFKLLITVEHGNAIMCSALHPSKCTTKVEQVYEVVHASCAAECTRGIVLRGAGDAGSTRLDVDCRCP